ncbi:MAG: hypothetical protein IT379_33270 [Deltaproteobacteria bacterium]|nr:hypothetical protein [Deltaproteobacteria bacterium]
MTACSAESGAPSGGGGHRDAGSSPDSAAGDGATIPGIDAGPLPDGGPGLPDLGGGNEGGTSGGTDPICNDGLDDDGDGMADEGCACVPGTAQECYPGDRAALGRGPCRRGTQGCSGSGEFGTWTECVGAVLPSDDVCLDGEDQDCNGIADDGASCVCEPMSTQACYTGPDGTRDVGICAPGMQMCVFERGILSWGDCLDQVLPRVEICGNGQDDDCNGAVDDAPGCECTTGTMRMCYGGPPAEIGVGVCRAGTQMCLAGGRYGDCVGEVGPSTETCGDGLDNDCNGTADDGCPTVVMVPVDLDGDCLTARCPPEAPYPVGCEITMHGDDPRGCVASSPTNPVVYFQEGDACGAGRVTGTLLCSSEPGAALNEGSCRINKSTRYYPTTRGGCPDT